MKEIEGTLDPHMDVVWRVNQRFQVFELLAEATQATPAQRKLCNSMCAIVAAYRSRDFLAAAAAAAALVEEFPGDVPALLYIERCQALLASPPGPDWDHICVLTEK